MPGSWNQIGGAYLWPSHRHFFGALVLWIVTAIYYWAFEPEAFADWFAPLLPRGCGEGSRRFQITHSLGP